MDYADKRQCKVAVTVNPPRLADFIRFESHDRDAVIRPDDNIGLGLCRDRMILGLNRRHSSRRFFSRRTLRGLHILCGAARRERQVRQKYQSERAIHPRILLWAVRMSLSGFQVGAATILRARNFITISRTDRATYLTSASVIAGYIGNEINLG